MEDRDQLYALLGELPPRDRPISATVHEVRELPHYDLEILTLDLNGLEPVPAYLTRPRGVTDPLPAVVYNHGHGTNFLPGKDELLTRHDSPLDVPYAEDLARRGIAAITIDAWNFGERRGLSEHSLFAGMLWDGRVLWGMMVYDILRATDYLVSRPDIDGDRIASMGISMGSTMAWWHAALDERVQACVDICCLSDMHTMREQRLLDGHGIYYYVPGLLREFSTTRINQLICPRAHLSLAGNHDPLTPTAGLDLVDEQLKQTYRNAGAAQNWELVRYDSGHFETADMRRRALAFLTHHLAC